MTGAEHAEIVAALREFLVENYLFDRGPDFALAANASLSELQVLDSMGVLALLNLVEERWAVRFAEDDVTPDNLDSLDRIAAFVRRRGAAAD